MLIDASMRHVIDVKRYAHEFNVSMRESFHNSMFAGYTFDPNKTEEGAGFH